MKGSLIDRENNLLLTDLSFALQLQVSEAFAKFDASGDNKYEKYRKASIFIESSFNYYLPYYYFAELG